MNVGTYTNVLPVWSACSNKYLPLQAVLQGILCQVARVFLVEFATDLTESEILIILGRAIWKKRP